MGNNRTIQSAKSSYSLPSNTSLYRVTWGTKYSLAVVGTTLVLGPFGFGRCVSTASIGRGYLPAVTVHVSPTSVKTPSKQQQTFLHRIRKLSGSIWSPYEEGSWHMEDPLEEGDENTHTCTTIINLINPQIHNTHRHRRIACISLSTHHIYVSLISPGDK